MALTTIITGRLPMPTDAPFRQAELVFTLSDWDKAGGDVFPPATVRSVLLTSNGTIPAGFALWRNSAGSRGTTYIVTVRWAESDRGHGQIPRDAQLGRIHLTGPGPVALADLLPLPAPVPNVPDALVQAVGAAAASQAAANQVAADRVVIEAAAAQATAFGSVYPQTDAQLASVLIPAPVQIMQRLPTATGQVAAANMVTRWRRTTAPGPEPYFTTAGGATWVAAEFTQAEMLSILTSVLAGIYDNPAFTGSARLANGTVAAPSLGFSNSPGTGFYRYADNQIGFATGGGMRAVLGTASWAINVPITGLAVTQSILDRTPGRLAKVGDPGIGGAASLAGTSPLHERDLTPGNYSYLSSGVPGGPESSGWNHTMQVMEGGAGATSRKFYICARSPESPGLGNMLAWVGWKGGAAAPILWEPLPVGAYVYPGPFADDAAAAAGGVAVNKPYRRSDGVMAWRAA